MTDARRYQSACITSDTYLLPATQAKYNKRVHRLTCAPLIGTILKAVIKHNNATRAEIRSWRSPLSKCTDPSQITYAFIYLKSRACITHTETGICLSHRTQQVYKELLLLHKHTQTHTNTHKHTQTHTHSHTHIHTHIHTHRERETGRESHTHTNTHGCTHT